MHPMIVMQDRQPRSHNQSMSTCVQAGSLKLSWSRTSLSVFSRTTGLHLQHSMGDTRHWYTALWWQEAEIFSSYFFFSTYLKWINYPKCTSCGTCNLAYTATHTCNAQQQLWNTKCICTVCSKLALHTATQRDLLHRFLQWPKQKRWFCMQCHAVNSYRKGSGVLTFAKSKKTMTQCRTYRDCL